ncbi:hypothetical protein V9T40_005642 [Parthenolecanium corni]|uniref:Uncharacterized protein n=1 Tax=Parthenolecanium corni TaxID=536013 RepID=A0AAN9TWR2_9HEMI
MRLADVGKISKASGRFRKRRLDLQVGNPANTRRLEFQANFKLSAGFSPRRLDFQANFKLSARFPKHWLVFQTVGWIPEALAGFLTRFSH